jgi:hypothetical protein
LVHALDLAACLRNNTTHIRRLGTSRVKCGTTSSNLTDPPEVLLKHWQSVNTCHSARRSLKRNCRRGQSSVVVRSDGMAGLLEQPPLRLLPIPPTWQVLSVPQRAQERRDGGSLGFSVERETDEQSKPRPDTTSYSTSEILYLDSVHIQDAVHVRSSGTILIIIEYYFYRGTSLCVNIAAPCWHRTALHYTAPTPLRSESFLPPINNTAS